MTVFERYTEKARRTIFFARYEASQFGSPYIETEHLLLGIVREDHGLVFRLKLEPESIRRQIEDKAVIREKVSTRVDLPLSNEGKRVLAYAAEEAELLSDRHIGTEHLLLGILREEKCLAAQLLQAAGVRLETTRKSISEVPAGSGETSQKSRAIALARPKVEFWENGETLPVTAQMFTLPQTADEIVLEFEEGQRLYKVESVRFIFERESPEGDFGVQKLNRLQVQVTSMGK